MTPKLERQLEENTELIIDEWVEQKHPHEVVEDSDGEEDDALLKLREELYG